jgi:hypothetical protein
VLDGKKYWRNPGAPIEGTRKVYDLEYTYELKVVLKWIK